MTEPPYPIVRVSVEELRQLFNAGRFWERLLAGELRASLKREGHPAPAASGQPYCTRSQEVFYFDLEGMEVARVHQYLRPDGLLGGSGRPDPKRLLQGGTLYRLSKQKEALSPNPESET
jgi:hypothetical protein